MSSFSKFHCDIQLSWYGDGLLVGQLGVCRSAGKSFSLLHSVQTGSRAQQATYPVGIGGAFTGIKVKNGGAIPPLPIHLHGIVFN
jgi:hypothetical protein